MPITSLRLFACCLFLNFSSYLSAYERGRGTYGEPNVSSWELTVNGNLVIGNFCSIAQNVHILLGGEHRPDWVTTYPFNCIWREDAGHITGNPRTKGDVIIGNDVWIGIDATILSGVTIGDGAVVGANSVVTKNVPPYAIVGGNPARIIRYRFDPETIEKLLRISWWNWSDEKIKSAVDYLLSPDIDQFIEYCEIFKLIPRS